MQGAHMPQIGFHFQCHSNTVSLIVCRSQKRSIRHLQIILNQSDCWRFIPHFHSRLVRLHHIFMKYIPEPGFVVTADSVNLLHAVRALKIREIPEKC